MYNILTIKNNKFSTDKDEHLTRIYVDSEEETELVGTLVRIEARSFRQRHQGTNGWDLFFVVPAEYDDKTKFIISHPEYVGLMLGRYSGENYCISLLERVETPLGDEWRELPIRLDRRTLAEASPSELKIVAKVALEAIYEGFGPHGEIKNAGELGDWAKGILAEEE